MKKPFLALKSRRDVLRIAFALTLFAAAVMLFFLPDRSTAVFSGEASYTPDSLFGLISNLL